MADPLLIRLPGHLGKSSLAVQYVDGHFVESYYPTIENTFTKIIKYKGQDYTTDIVDTAGQDEYSILNSKHFIGIHGYMLVYSVSSFASFEMVQVIRDKILNHLVRICVPATDKAMHGKSLTSSPSARAGHRIRPHCHRR
jgi:small GTP-binding protein